MYFVNRIFKKLKSQFFSSVAVSNDSVTVSQNLQYQYTECYSIPRYFFVLSNDPLTLSNV